MSTLRIQLFGKFSLQRDSQLLKGLAANKEQELLSYLLVRRDRSHPRETLASVLWGNTSTERSKKYLRQALWHVQAALEAGEPTGTQLLVVEHNWVQLNLQREVWLDVEVFEQAFATTHDRPGNQLDASDAALLKNAVELYKGELLDGWYQDWCIFERERLQNIYLCMLEKLMGYCEKQSEYEGGQRYGSTILSYDRAHERTYRQLMRMHHKAGDRTGALRHYQRCVAALDEELGIKPERRTKELYEYIRNDESTEMDTAASASTPVGVSLPDILRRLKQLHSVLAGLQERVHRDIKTVERTLDKH
jgi:DNA-binding transcriptional activator of the SARP family